MANYKVWDYDYFDGNAQLTEEEGLEDEYRIMDGEDISFLEEPITFSMDPDSPNENIPGDSVLNDFLLAIVSSRLKSHLESFCLPHLQFKEVSIKNHKGKRLPERFFLMQPRDQIDAMDEDRSDFDTSQIDGGVSTIRKLVLDESKVPEGRGIFRLKNFEDTIVVIGEIADQLEAKNYKGLRLTPIDDYSF